MIRRRPISTPFPYTTLFRSGLVVHRQHHAGDRLREEGEHRGRAERVEPVRALRGLAVEEAAQERAGAGALVRSEEHTSELQSRQYLVCRLLLEKKNSRRQIA